MPLFASCLSCSTSSSPVDHATAKLPGPEHTHLSTSSSSSSAAGSSSSTSDDAVSIQTFPSLPSLHSFPSLDAPTPHTSVSSHLLFSNFKNTPQQYRSSTNNSAPAALALSSTLLFSFSQSGTSVYDLTDLRQVSALPSLSSAGSVKCVAVAYDAIAIAIFTAHQDGKIRAWAVSNSEPKLRLVSSLPTLSDRLTRFALPSNYVAVRRHNRRLWIEHADAVSSVAVRGGLLYSVSWDKTLKVWRASDRKCVESLTAHDDAVNAVAVGPDGTVYTGSADRRIKVWVRGPGRRGRHVAVATLLRHKSAVNSLAVSGDGSVLYSGACDRSILVWEREESANFMACSGVLRGHRKAILCLSTVGIDLVASGSNDRTVRIWRRRGAGEGYNCLCVLEGHVTGVRSVVVAKQEEEGAGSLRVCSGSLDGEVRVWRVRVENCKGSDKEL